MSESVSSSGPASAASAGVSPVVVALIGLPGAGKSVVARALADQLGLRRVCRDTIRHAMFPVCSYTFAEKRAAFRADAARAGNQLPARRIDRDRRRDVLAPGPISCASTARFAAATGFTPIPIYLDCPARVAHDRIAREVEHNRHLARDRSPDLVYEVQARFDPPPPNALVINANQPAADVCRIVVDAVAGIRRGSPASDVPTSGVA